ncbi:MAG: transporter substrate-binding domain-containing protein [Pseudomonadota bacterium]
MRAWITCVVLLCLGGAVAPPARAASASTPAAASAIPHTLRACGDISEFPPYLYAQRAGGRKTAVAAGLDVDLLKRIIGDSGRAVDITLLPWARCLAMGSRGQTDILLDGIKSPLRTGQFLFPSSHYALTPIFLYLKGRPRPAMDSAAQLAHSRVCSQADYNYESFGIPNAIISNRARTIDDAATMLKVGRCEIMLQQVETLRGHAQLGGVDLMNSPEFERETPAWLKQIDFYFMVGKTVPYGKELIDLLDKGVVSLKRDGEIERLRSKHQLR